MEAQTHANGNQNIKNHHFILIVWEVARVESDPDAPKWGPIVFESYLHVHQCLGGPQNIKSVHHQKRGLGSFSQKGVKNHLIVVLYEIFLPY